MREKGLLQLNELKEIDSDSCESSRIYKERKKRWHDKHIHQRKFQVSNLAILFNSRLMLVPSKLCLRWLGLF